VHECEFDLVAFESLKALGKCFERTGDVAFRMRLSVADSPA